MSTGEDREPTEDELRAAYEAQIKNIRVEHVVLENVVTLANLGMRRTGLAPGTEDERDPDQVKLAIESIRAQLPLVEQITPEQARQIRDALSQLQLAYVRIGGEASAVGGSEPAPAGPGGPPAPEGPGEPPAPAGPGEPLAPEDGEPAAPQSSSEAGDSPPAPKPGETGPAQRSGRLWVPGQ
jgi:hypothetical protein